MVFRIDLCWTGSVDFSFGLFYIISEDQEGIELENIGDSIIFLL
jgi:hypothetical protein